MTSLMTRADKAHRARCLGVRAADSWSAAEERSLRVEFRRGSSLDELAHLHRRAVHDVRSRLVRLGEFTQAFRPAAKEVVSGRGHAVV